ncbi:MAG: YdcF family protein [Bacteroidales bacterium]|nr:YdcF family protein [Bacteroidales bacterium]MCF8458146.1 YdcF family protein [Bacteroidales bacterium]
MFFYISKLLSFLLSPAVWIVGLLALAVFTKKDKLKKRSVFWAFLVAVLFTNPFLFDEVMRAWERPAIAESALQKKYDFGIVLGGGLRYDAQLGRTDAKAASDRLFQAIDLYRNNHIKKILISGGSPMIFKSNLTEAEMCKKYLLRIGIPARDILIETESRNTHENAEKSTALILSEKKKPDCLLITSAYHMKRAKDCFTQSKLDVDEYPVDRYAGPRKFKLDHLFIPSPIPFQGWHIFIREFVGYYIYALMGYV